MATLAYRMRREVWRLRRGSAVFAKQYLGFPPGRPDFLIIGAQKAGTSSLYAHLIKHPTVRSPGKKECHFFDRWYHRGERWYLAQFPTHAVPGRAPFQTGEATPEYLYHPLAPERAHRLMPDVRLIVLLRDPVARAYSSYQHQRANGREDLSFADAIRAEPQRLQAEAERKARDPSYRGLGQLYYSYLARGRYLEQIRRWLEFYPRTQILIQQAEPFFQNPAAVVNSVTRFLGIADLSLPSYPPKNTREYTTMDPHIRAKLYEYFGPFNEELFDFLGHPYDWQP
jgi:hypothetical protein